MFWKPISLIPPETKIDFFGLRKLTFVVSTLFILASIVTYVVRDLNYGIDFDGGIMIDVVFPEQPDLSVIREQLQSLGLGEIEIQEFGGPENILIKIQRQDGDEKSQMAAIGQVKALLGDNLDYRRTEFVGPKVGGELIEAGITAVLCALIAMLMYIWLRFDGWQFGIGAVIALVHDVTATIGIFAMMQLEFNLSTVAAILTIAGYSINDTVVVYDRIRENLRKFRKMPIGDLLNLSTNQTLSRTAMTSLTTLLALLALFYFGGAVIHDFVFAMMWGVFIGTYSSIFIAAPLLSVFHLRRDGETVPAASETS